MRPEEADKIIAAFMGYIAIDSSISAIYNGTHGKVSGLYSQSLDALIPVWQKLDDWDADLAIRWCNNEWQVDFNGNYLASDSVQQAAAIATAKAILELNKGE